jgi:transcriptional regulator with XRE-family HTH domain
MKIGEVLKAWRCMGGMSLAEASGYVGILLPTLQRIEQGKPMDGVTMWKIMVFLFGA